MYNSSALSIRVLRYIFLYFSKKRYVVDTHLKHLTEALLMNTQNISFHEEIRDISILFGRKHLPYLKYNG